ncbi:alpha/beta hydrolase [Actinopolymorpha sp. B9G3]|uniref:alpha/beta fold hydrolase n=1 Tax=Actinopolymorpha sp. B9G3 TaxID=3158970 RepID=UPI0032D8DC88
MSRRVDVGGLKLAAEIVGDGTPPVVFVTGLNDDRHVWDAVRSSLKARTMTVTYERPDLGESDPLPHASAGVAQSYGAAAEQLRSLLDAADVPAPRVLVGHSIGGLIIHVFASRWPDQVAGLVYVDATDPELYIDVTGFGPTVADNDHGMVFDWRAGLEEFTQVGVPHVPAVVVASPVGRWSTAKSPEKYAPYSMADVDERWQGWQRRLAGDLGAPLLIARKGGHYVHTDVPTLVGHAVDAAVEAVRGQTDPQFDPATVQSVGGTVAGLRSS